MVRTKSQQSETLLQERQEVGEQVVHKIHELMESWEKRITPDNLRIAERFLDLELHVLLHIRIKDSGEMRVLCCEKVVGIQQPFPGQQNIVVHGKKCAVLIDVVKLVDSPESIVPVFVRVESIDGFYSVLPHTLYFSNLFGFVSRGVLGDGKLDSSIRFTPVGAYQYELIGKMIESTPQVMENISSNGERIEGQHGKFLDSAEDLSGLLIWLGSHDLFFSVSESAKQRFEVCEVLFGPFNFYAHKRGAAFSI